MQELATALADTGSADVLAAMATGSGDDS